MEQRDTYRIIKARPARSERGLYELIDVLGHKRMREALLEPFTQLHSGLVPQGSETRHGRI